MWSIYKFFFAFILVLSKSVLVYSYNFEADDSVHYRIDWKPYSQMPEFLRVLDPDSSRANSVVYMTSADKNGYVCEVPNPKKEAKKETSTYSGPSPAQLIEPLHRERICFYWLDVYWTYELCHGRYVLQFHEEKETSRRARTEYYLGNYARDQAKLDEEHFNKNAPPIRRIDDLDLAYFAVTYKHGTVCDLTGKPRTTVVMYACKRGGKDGIYAFAETSSCNYEMIVLTERLCSHPAFRPAVTSEYEINCYSRDFINGTVKPLSLLKIEKEDATALEREYGLVPPHTVDASWSLKAEQRDKSNPAVFKDKSLSSLSPQSKEEEDDDDVDDDDDDNNNNVDNDDLDSVSIKEAHPATSKRRVDKVSQFVKSTRTSYSQETLLENQNLLSGRSCLHGGGTGWWKYEFCYGKSVIQYHEDGKVGRVEVLLGRFNGEIQKLWIEQNPQKQPLKVGNKIQEVYHIYSGGDICEEKKFRRSVEVRIRCVEFQGSSTAVSLSLIEPTACQYILRVESTRFCETLQKVDDYGLLKPESAASTKGKDSNQISKTNTEL